MNNSAPISDAGITLDEIIDELARLTTTTALTVGDEHATNAINVAMRRLFGPGNPLGRPALAVIPQFVVIGGRLYRAGESANVVQHSGTNSVIGGGIFNSDICDIKIEAPTSPGTFMQYLVDIVRERQMFITNSAENASIRMASTVTSMQSAMQPGIPILVPYYFSKIWNERLEVHEQRITVREVMVKGRVEASTYRQWLKGSVFNNQQLEHFTTTVLTLNVAESNILRSLTSSLITQGSAIVANHFMYYKLFCNAFARARMEVAEIPWHPPVINNNNSTLTYVTTGMGANAGVNFTPANLLRWSGEQHFAFFQNRDAAIDVIQILEILGYDGFYCLPNPANHTVPWQGISFPGVPVIYFCNEQHDHIAADISSASIWAWTWKIANDRREWDDAVRGLKMAIELMAGNLQRHQRYNRRFRDDRVLNLNPDMPRLGDATQYPTLPAAVPRAGKPDYQVIGDDINASQNPNEACFIGDAVMGRNQYGTYTQRDYQFLLLDAFHQFRLSPATMSIGTNWFQSMLGIVTSNETKPPFINSILHYDAMAIIRMFVAGYAIVSAAASATCISFNITGIEMDHYCRGVGRPSFTTFVNQLLLQPNSGTLWDAPYFWFVYETIKCMTGMSYNVEYWRRSFNAALPYYADHGDRNGVYWFMCGAVNLRNFSLLTIDNYIISRPREFGIFIPGVKAELGVGVIASFNNNTCYIVTHKGDETIKSRFPYGVLRGTNRSYINLFLNAILSSLLRGVTAQCRFRPYVCSASENIHNQNWVVAANADAPPSPAMFHALGIMDVGGTVTFDWARGNFVCWSVVPPQLANHIILTSAQQPEVDMYGAGIILTRGPGVLTAPGIQQPQSMLLPWQLGAQQPPNVPDSFGISRSAYDSGLRDYSAPGDQPASSGQMPASTNINIDQRGVGVDLVTLQCAGSNNLLPLPTSVNTVSIGSQQSQSGAPSRAPPSSGKQAIASTKPGGEKQDPPAATTTTESTGATNPSQHETAS